MIDLSNGLMNNESFKWNSSFRPRFLVISVSQVARILVDTIQKTVRDSESKIYSSVLSIIRYGETSVGRCIKVHIFPVHE